MRVSKTIAPSAFFIFKNLLRCSAGRATPFAYNALLYKANTIRKTVHLVLFYCSQTESFLLRDRSRVRRICVRTTQPQVVSPASENTELPEPQVRKRGYSSVEQIQEESRQAQNKGDRMKPISFIFIGSDENRCIY